MTATADASDSSTVEQLTQAVESLQNIVEQQAEWIETLEDELADYRNHNERDKAEIRQKITDVENQTMEARSGDTTSERDANNKGSPNVGTPLERICTLPEHIADRELTTNQERARFIARDIQDYTEKAPAGLVIDSRTIKRVLTAAEGTRPHTQTIARVMNFLDDLGKDDVELTKRRGRKLLVVDPTMADRLANHERCDRGNGPSQSDGVISSG